MITLTMQSHTATAEHYASTHSCHLGVLHRQYPLSSQARAGAPQASVTAMRRPTCDAISMALWLLISLRRQMSRDCFLQAQLTLFTALCFLDVSDPYRSRRSCSSSWLLRHGVTTNRVRGGSMARRWYLAKGLKLYNSTRRTAVDCLCLAIGRELTPGLI
jgi:hypothetical protein